MSTAESCSGVVMLKSIGQIRPTEQARNSTPLSYSGGQTTRVPEISPRQILTDNINHLIGTGSVRAWALSKKLDVKLIDRISKGENAVTLDTLMLLADRCGVTVQLLLTPGMKSYVNPDTAELAHQFDQLPMNTATDLQWRRRVFLSALQLIAGDQGVPSSTREFAHGRQPTAAPRQ